MNIIRSARDLQTARAKPGTEDPAKTARRLQDIQKYERLLENFVNTGRWGI